VFLIGEVGQPHTAKIVDFGLAKVAGQRGLTQYGTAVGTIQFMAPEQAVGDEADPRTDVYGLGMTMYRMFSGRLPFDGTDEATVLAQQLAAIPAPLALGRTKEAQQARGSCDARAPQEEGEPLRIDAGARGRSRPPSAAPEPLTAESAIGGDDTYEPVGAFAKQAVVFLSKRLPKG